MRRIAKRLAAPLLGALALLGAALLPQAASAGVATAGAVLLDPFDPVPAIGFHHFGGYGCYDSCGGGGYDRCNDGCGRPRHHQRRDGCEDGCYRADRDRHHRHRDRCDRDCGDDDYGGDGDRDDHGDHGDQHDEGDGGNAAFQPAPPPCPVGRCSDSEHWERHWRQGDHVGQQWFARGYRQRNLDTGKNPPDWYGKPGAWDDTDEDPPPPPPVTPDPPKK